MDSGQVWVDIGVRGRSEWKAGCVRVRVEVVSADELGRVGVRVLVRCPILLARRG